MRFAVFLLGVWLLALTACENAESTDKTPMEEGKKMSQKLQLRFEDQTLSAVLYDNAATRDFIAQLPLSVTLTDYNATEKIADLPGKLSQAGAPDGFAPVAGDVAYYVPWGNLAVFYRDFRYSSGLILIGKLEGDGAAILGKKNECKVQLQLAEPNQGGIRTGL